MKNSKLISLILAMFVLCTALLSADAFADKADWSYDEANAALTYILGDVFTQDKVTRAEFTSALVRLMKTENTDTQNFSFEDVDKKGSASVEIYSAVNAGIVSAADKFYPNEPITYSQAVKMCICAIDYSEAAEAKGGYPSGYMQVARRIDIIDYGCGEYDILTRQDAVKLLYNLICTSIMPVGIENNSVHYSDTGVNYLERLYNIVSCEGIVTSNNINPEGDDIAVDISSVTVGGITFKYNGDSAGLLGKNVCVFYRKGERRALFLAEKGNNEVTLRTDDITKLENGKIYTEDKDRNKNTYNAAGARYVYNGRSVEKFSLDMLSGDFSNLVLLDNDDDNIYEYVFVYDWKYLYVDIIKPDTEIISDINNDAKNTFAPKPNAVLTVYGADGSLIERDDIKKNDFIAVAQSKDGAAAVIRKIENKISGVITSINGSGEILIDDKAYTLSDYAERNYSDVIQTGSDYTFVIGLDGDIAAILNFSSQMKYGYLIDAAPSSGALSDEALLKIYTMSGEIKIFGVKQAKVDGTKPLKSDGILAVLGKNLPQLIRYKTNSDDKIVVIDTAVTVSEFDDFAEDDENRLKKYEFYSGGSLVTRFTYRSGGQSCMPYFNISSTPILSVSGDGADENDFALVDRSSLRSGAAYDFEVYDLADNGTAGFILARGQSIKSHTNCMIEKITNGLMPDGSTGKVLHVCSKGKFFKIYLGSGEEAQLNKPLNAGDIVEITLNSDNSVKYIDLVFDSASFTTSSTTVTGINYEGLSNISYWHGSLYYTDGIYAYISKTKGIYGYDYSMSSLINIKISGSNIAVINKDKTEIRLVTSDELKDYKSFGTDNYYLVVRLNAQAPMEVYAYETE